MKKKTSFLSSKLYSGFMKDSKVGPLYPLPYYAWLLLLLLMVILLSRSRRFIAIVRQLASLIS